MDSLLFRTDAGPEIGAGHVMRCLALALAWREAGGRAVFLTHEDTLSIPRWRNTGLEAVLLPDVLPAGSQENQSAAPGKDTDAAATLRLADEIGARWIVVDGYHFDTRYQQLLANGNHRILWIDDQAHASPYCADLLLNQNPHATDELYADRSANTRLLLGSRFALLRPEFRRPFDRSFDERTTRVLVTLGGADPTGLTGRLVEVLAPIFAPDIECRIVVGPLARHDTRLSKLGDQYSNLHLLDSVPDMAEQMAWAQLAIAAAGSTCWELAVAGVPALLVSVADNQRPLAAAMSRWGAAIDLGPAETLEPAAVIHSFRALAESAPARAAASDSGPDKVDGRGVDRVLQILQQQSSGDGVDDRCNLRSAITGRRRQV